MYVRVMAENAQCSDEGPFFPSTPRYVIQNGIALESGILLAPDWITIGLVMGLSVLLCILLVIALMLFRRYGWNKQQYIRPKYRSLTQENNLDDLASKGSTVHHVKKYHRALEGSNQESEEGGGTVEAVTMKSDEYWDYDKQVDMEGFTTSDFYDHLSRQSRHVTTELGRQKDEAKSLYQKLNDQAQSLKGLWVAKLNLKGKAALATEADLAAYESKKSELELELERRRELGMRMEAYLKRQGDLLREDERYKEDHQILFLSCLSEATRLMNEYSEKLAAGGNSLEQHFDDTMQNHVMRRVGALLVRMNSEVSAECQRLGAWGVLGQGTGGLLITPGSTDTPLPMQDLFGADGKLQQTAVTKRDPATGLVIPTEGSRMLQASGQAVDIPQDSFVHPVTGQVLPMKGNVAYDTMTSRLIVTVDTASPELPRSDEGILPFVPYPKHPTSGAYVECSALNAEQPEEIKLGAPMSDPDTGLLCPILAITIHPDTGVAYPLCGTHVDPVTGLPLPIEIGSLMIDPSSDQPVPILDITIDPETGDVIPIGGVTQLQANTHDAYAPMVAGEKFVDPVSMLTAHIGGARLEGSEVMPCGGSYQTLLQASLMANEIEVISKLKTYLDHLIGPEGGNCRHEVTALEATVKDMTSVRQRLRTHTIRHKLDVERRMDRASILAVSGGSPGMYEFAETGQLLPILVGTLMTDLGGSGQKVPILGVDKSPETGRLMPLGGTMEDHEGNGLVPIMIGLKAVDPVTGDLGPVTGVRINIETSAVVPVTLTGSTKKTKPPLGAVAMIEDELVARRGFWRRQRQREEEMVNTESHLTNQLVLEIEHLDPNKIESSLDAIADLVKTVEDHQRREVERRAEATEELNTIMPASIMAVLSQGDEPENLTSDKHNIAHTKYVNTVTKFTTRLQAEETKYKERMEELKDALNPDAEAGALHRYRQAKARLLSDLKDQLLNRTENIDEDHAALEYSRERTELLTIEAKALLTNAVVIAGTYDATISGVYGDTTETEQSTREILPLLKQLIAMLERGSTFTLSADLIQGLNMEQGSVMVGAQTSVINRNIVKGNDYTVNVNQQKGYVPPQQPGGKTNINLLQTAPDSRPVTAVSTNPQSKLVVQNTLQSLTEDSKTDLAKSLVERQTLECVKLEEELKAEEIKTIGDIIKSHEDEKEKKVNAMKEELKTKLQEAQNEEEKEKLLEAFVAQSGKVSSKIEEEKQQQLESHRKKLAEKRARKKKELHNKHLNEARQEGLSEDLVPEMTEEDEDQQAKLQRLLMLQQNKLLAQLKQSYLEDDLEAEEKRTNGFDEDMEARMRQFNLTNRPKMAAILDDLSAKTASTTKSKGNMKEKMKARMNKRRATRTAKDILPSGMDPESTIALNYLAADEAQQEADGARGLSAAMEVLGELNKDKQIKQVEEAIQKILTEEDNLTQEEKDQLLEQYKDIVKNAEEQMEDSKQTQRDHLMAKLAARKRLKEDVLKEEAVAKELEHLSKQQVLRGNAEGQDALEEVHSRAQNDEADVKKDKLLENQQHRQEALEISQQVELKKVLRGLEEEKGKMEGAVAKQLDEQKEEVLMRKQQAFDKEMLLKGKQLSEDKSKQLMEQHQKEMESLSQSMDDEKRRQQQAVADRIAQRKQQKQDRLKQLHEAEMKQELLKQRAERDQLVDQQYKDVERGALVDALNADKTSKAENVIYRVLRQRHIKEQVHQEEQMEQEKEVEMARIRAKASEQLQKARDDLVEAQQQEILELVANSGSMSPEDLQEKKEALQRQHKKQLQEFDRGASQKIDQAMKDCMPALEVKHAQVRLALREKQLQELAEAMRDLSPEEALVQQYTELAERAAGDAQKFRETKVAEMQSELVKLKADKKKREDARKAKMEEEVTALEAELENDKRKEEERERRRQQEKERTMEQQKMEAERRLQNELQSNEGNQAAKEKLMQEHAENMKRFEENFQKEQERNANKTKARLEARLRKKREQELSRIEGEVKNQEDVDERRTQDQMNLIQQKGASELNKTNIDAWRPETPGDWAQRKQDGLDEKPDLPEGVNQAMYSALMASPFFTDLKDIEEMLQDTLGFKPGVKGSLSDAFIDLKDAQWILGSEITPLDIESISPSQFVVYRFGVFITHLLRLTLRTPEVTLLLASSLPQNDYRRNMFRHSFFYQRAKKILFVRQERLESVGEFVMVIVHCLAHIKVGDLDDDTNPLFLREFFKGMKIICQDMFFSRAKMSRGGRALVGGMLPKGKRPLEALFKAGKVEPEKANVVLELIDTRVKHTDKEDFTQENVKERLSKEQEETSASRLREYMVTHGGFKSTADFVETRLKELRGVSQKKGNSETPMPTIQVSAASTLRSHRELIDLQISQTHTQLDQLYNQLTKVFSDLQATREGLREGGSSGKDETATEVLRMQASGLEMKITNLTKKIEQMESELTKKCKERDSASP